MEAERGTEETGKEACEPMAESPGWQSLDSIPTRLEVSVIHQMFPHHDVK